MSCEGFLSYLTGGSTSGAPEFGDDQVSTTEHDQATRRDFIYYATAGAGAVITGAAVWPLVNQMNPSADVLALASIRVDVSSLDPGTQMTVLFQGKPVFIRRRTAEEIADARGVEMSELIDPEANNANLADSDPATDENRALTNFTPTNPDGTPGEPVGVAGEWLVQSGVCTHLGCVPVGAGEGLFGGWFCPCHGSHYDIAGRIRQGPAPRNLPIPEASFVDETTIQLG